MADLKISALPAASVALAGTEVLPIVQSSATKQVTVANLTAGRAVATGALTVTGDATLSTGNLVIGTSGKGIDFSATPGTGTSELLSDYEEGTWDSRIAFGGSDTASYTGRVGYYTRIGRQVTVNAFIGTMGNGAATGAVTIINLPFSIVNAYGSFALFMEGISYTGMAVGSLNVGASTLSLVKITEAGALSALTNADWSASTDLRFTATYFV